jgi:hypothetical protein
MVLNTLWPNNTSPFMVEQSWAIWGVMLCEEFPGGFGSIITSAWIVFWGCSFNSSHFSRFLQVPVAANIAAYAYLNNRTLSSSNVAV